MTREEVMKVVSDTIADTFMVDSTEINSDTTAIDIPGWDSLSHIILLSNIEDNLNKELDLENAEFENVGQLADFIFQRI